MGKFEEYLDRAKDLAEEAGDMAKGFAGNVAERAKDLTDEGSKVRELAQSARNQTSAFTLSAREKVHGVLQDARAVKEISQGISELEALPEFEGSILYTMEYESTVNDLRALMLIISDSRLDDGSVAEEIRKVMGKVRPAYDTQSSEDAGASPLTDEEQAINTAKTIAYTACERAMGALNI